jgi:GNAT superfamily N-acetyltransferase
MDVPLSPPEKLATRHNTAAFDCGREPLNCFLQKFALANQQNGSAQTYVVCQNQRVVGFYSLSVGSVLPAETPAHVSQGLARHPIPVMLLARLAVDRNVQGRGLGKALLKDALLRTAAAADIAGLRALLVHAKDESARNWNLAFDFEPSPTNPFHLFLLMKDLRAALKK